MIADLLSMILASEAVTSTILASLMAAVATLSGAVVFLWKQQSRIAAEALKTKTDEIARLKTREDELERRISDLNRRVYDLEIEKKDLETRFMIFSSTHDSSPIPCWIKDTSGRVLSCNQAYEDAFLRPIGKKLADYVGHDDFAVWPDEVAKAFRENDEMVRKSRQTWIGEELIQGPHGETYKTRIVKYPRTVPGFPEPFGIAGIAPDIVVDSK